MKALYLASGLSGLTVGTAVLAAPALAHQVETFYFFDPAPAITTAETAPAEAIAFQSTFSTGEPFAGATVEIFAPNDATTPWQVLSTDEEGRFSFVPDETIQGDWEISIEQDGHADYWTVPVGETGIVYDSIVLEGATDRHVAGASGLMVAAALLGLGALGLRRNSA